MRWGMEESIDDKKWQNIMPIATLFTRAHR
jgi:hypothetical protein